MSIFFNYETGGKDNEKKLSAEQLLTIFNRNIVKNAELLDYLDKKNIFEVIAKSSLYPYMLSGCSGLRYRTAFV